MSILAKVRAIFLLAGVYDVGIGLTFLFASDLLFERFIEVPLPHPGYVQFPALLIVIFGLMFLAVAWAPQRNRNLIPFGILLKASYSGVVIPYWITRGVDDIWKPFAVIDLVFLVLFIWAFFALRRAASAATGP